MKKIKYTLIPMSEKEKTLKSLRSQCWHEIIEHGDSGGSICTKCGLPYSIMQYGWYCPDSPDHQCHYYSKVDEKGKRYIITINDEKVILKNHKGKYESQDFCLFCGNPSERK